MLLVDRHVVGRRSPWAKQTPYVVSEEAKTTLRMPRRVAASSTL